MYIMVYARNTVLYKLFLQLAFYHLQFLIWMIIFHNMIFNVYVKYIVILLCFLTLNIQ